MRNSIQCIKRKSLLYRTGVEYGDFTINHVEGCSHGCTYPCYAMMMAKRFGRIKNYEDWIKPKIVENAIELLKSEIPKYIDKINFVHLCFTTDPFMHNQTDCINLSLDLLRILNEEGIKCTALTKGILPSELTKFNKNNEYGITLVSLNEEFRNKYEPFTASYNERIMSLYHLHKNGFKTWISIEPYPTPNIVNQELDDILDSVSFVDKVIFGRLNYNPKVSQYSEYQQFYNDLCMQAIDFCNKEGKEFHIKKGTLKSLASVSNSLGFLSLRPTESRI